MIAKIPFNKIEKIEIYHNVAKKSMSSIKNSLKCDYIINAGFFEMTKFVPVCGLVVNNKELSSVKGTYGMSLNGNTAKLTYENSTKAPYYVGAFPLLIKDGKKYNFSTPTGLGGDRGRSAIGVTKDSLVLLCVADVSNTSDLTLAEEANELLAQGCIDAINLDGGGSAQCNFNGSAITSIRIVNNFICVWTKKEEETSKQEVKKYKVIAASLYVRSGPNTTYPTIGGLRANDIVESSKTSNGWAYIDKLKGWSSLSYLKQVNSIAPTEQKYKVNTLALIMRSGPSTSYTRKGLLTLGTIVSISETKNGWGYIPAKNCWCNLTYLTKMGG